MFSIWNDSNNLERIEMRVAMMSMFPIKFAEHWIENATANGKCDAIWNSALENAEAGLESGAAKMACMQVNTQTK